MALPAQPTRMRIGSSVLPGGCGAPRRPAGARPERLPPAALSERLLPERLPAVGELAPRRVFRPDAERVVALRSVPLPFVRCCVPVLRRPALAGSARAVPDVPPRGRAEPLGARVAMVTTVTTNVPLPKDPLRRV